MECEECGGGRDVQSELGKVGSVWEVGEVHSELGKVGRVWVECGECVGECGRGAQ